MKAEPSHSSGDAWEVLTRKQVKTKENKMRQITITNKPMPLPVAGYGSVVKMKTAADIEAEAERMVNRLYEQQGGDNIEVALQVLLVANLWLISRAYDVINAIRKSNIETERDKRGYMIDVVSCDGKLRSIINGALNTVKKVEAKVITFTATAGNNAKEDDFTTLCADSADEYDSILKPLTDALIRYCLERQTSRGKIAADPWMVADATQLYAMSELVKQMYDLLGRKVFPIIDRMGVDFRSLNGLAIRDAVQKVGLALPFDNVNASEIVSGKEGSTLLQDICKVTFSTECLDRIFKARGCTTSRVLLKSLIPEWEDNTMSINYYHQHYNAAWREVEFKRKKKR